MNEKIKSAPTLDWYLSLPKDSVLEQCKIYYEKQLKGRLPNLMFSYLFEGMPIADKEQILPLILIAPYFQWYGHNFARKKDFLIDFYIQFKNCNNFSAIIFQQDLGKMVEKILQYSEKDERNELYKNISNKTTLSREDIVLIRETYGQMEFDQKQELFKKLFNTKGEPHEIGLLIQMLPDLSPEQKIPTLEKLVTTIRAFSVSDLNKIFNETLICIFFESMPPSDTMKYLLELELTVWAYISVSKFCRLASCLDDNLRAVLFSTGISRIVKRLVSSSDLEQLFIAFLDKSDELIESIIKIGDKHTKVNLFTKIETILFLFKHINQKNKKLFTKFLIDGQLLFKCNATSNQFKALITEVPEIKNELMEMFRASFPFYMKWSIEDVLNVVDDFVEDQRLQLLHMVLINSTKGYHLIQSISDLKRVDVALQNQLLSNPNILANILINNSSEEIKELVKHDLNTFKKNLISYNKIVLSRISIDKIIELIRLFPQNNDVLVWISSPFNFDFLDFNFNHLTQIAQNFSNKDSAFSLENDNLNEKNLEKLIDFFPESYSLIFNFCIAHIKENSFTNNEHLFTIFKRPEYQWSLLDIHLSCSHLELFKMLSKYPELFDYYNEKYQDTPLTKDEIIQLFDTFPLESNKIWNYLKVRKFIITYEDLLELAEKLSSPNLNLFIHFMDRIPGCTLKQILKLRSTYKLSFQVVKKLLPMAFQDDSPQLSEDFFRDPITYDTLIDYANLVSEPRRETIVKKTIMSAHSLSIIIKIASLCKISAASLESVLVELPLSKQLSELITSSLKSPNYSHPDFLITQASFRKENSFFDNIDDLAFERLITIDKNSCSVIYNLILFHKFSCSYDEKLYVIQFGHRTVILPKDFRDSRQYELSVSLKNNTSIIQMLANGYYTVPALEQYVSDPKYFGLFVTNVIELIQLNHFFPEKKDEFNRLFQQQHIKHDCTDALLALYETNSDNDLYTFLLANKIPVNLANQFLDYPNNSAALCNLLLNPQFLQSIATSKHNIQVLARLFPEHRADLFRALITHRIVDQIQSSYKVMIFNRRLTTQHAKSAEELQAIFQVKTVVNDLMNSCTLNKLSYSKSDNSAILFEELLTTCHLDYFTTEFLTTIFMRPVIKKSRAIEDLIGPSSGNDLTFREDRALGSLFIDEVHNMCPTITISKDLVDKKNYQASIILEHIADSQISVTPIAIIECFISRHKKLRPVLFNWLVEKEILDILLVNANDLTKLIELFPEKKSLLQARHLGLINNNRRNRKMTDDMSIVDKTGSIRLFKVMPEVAEADNLQTHLENSINNSDI